MHIILPYGYDEKCTTVSQSLPYLRATETETYIMKKEDIILRLESALENKDWADIELLLEDLQLDDEDIDEDYFSDTMWGGEG
tara:strand:- start:2667 stop:2915 length:249 start_codon:yes stop_codon:yes gene_type:complete